VNNLSFFAIDSDKRIVFAALPKGERMMMKNSQEGVSVVGVLRSRIASANAGVIISDSLGYPNGHPVGQGGRRRRATNRELGVERQASRGGAISRCVGAVWLLLLLALPSHGTLSIGGLSEITETFNSLNPPTGQDPVSPSPYVFKGDWTYSGTDFNPGGLYTVSSGYRHENSAYGLRISTRSGDIAFGNKMGANEAPLHLTLHARNNTGATINRFELGWNVEQYSQAGRATTVSFDWSTDGLDFNLNHVTGGAPVSAVTGPAGNLASVLKTPVSATIIRDLPAGQEVYFRFTWKTGSGSGDNAHLGVDDFSVTAVPEPSTYLAGGFAVGLLALTFRNRPPRRLTGPP
jgi:hypothetical protein